MVATLLVAVAGEMIAPALIPRPARTIGLSSGFGGVVADINHHGLSPDEGVTGINVIEGGASDEKVIGGIADIAPALSLIRSLKSMLKEMVATFLKSSTESSHNEISAGDDSAIPAAVEKFATRHRRYHRWGHRRWGHRWSSPIW